MNAIFLTRESPWAASALVRGALWKKAIEAQEGSLRILCLESLFHLKRRTDYHNLYKLYLALKTYLLLSRREFDLLVINRINYHTLGAVLFCRLHRKKYILDVDDWEYRSAGRRKTLFQGVGDYIARSALLVVVASKFLEKYFSFCKRTVYIPSCVALPRHVPRNKADEALVFCWMGMVDRPEVVESVQEVLGVFHELKAKYSFIRLRIIGRGIFLQGLKRLQRTCETGAVRFYYDAEPGMLPGLLEGIHVGILTFKRDDLFYRAKSPTRLFQYVSLGKPVIASSIGECASFIRNGVNGYLVRTREELAQAMETFCRQPGLVDSFSRRARAVALEWNADTVGERLLCALKEAV